MDATLASFGRALRAAGVDVSTGASIDAARAVTLVGYADRARLKTSLGLVLAQSAHDKTIYDRVFEQFFSPPASAPTPGHAAGGEAAGGEAAATGQPAIDALLALVQAAERGAGGHLDARVGRAAATAGADDIRFASQIPYYVGQAMDALGIAPLDARLRALVLDPNPKTQRETIRLIAGRNQLQRHVRTVIEQRFALFGKPATETFLTGVAINRQLGRMGSADLERMKAAVSRMARRLAVKHSRRRRIAARGKLDVRRTLRANAGRDGVPFDLMFKYKRRDRPRIVAICDVSASVAPQVHFLLLFLFALHGAIADLRTFAFSNRLVDIASPLKALPFDDAMAFILKEYGSGTTDYGQAFTDLDELHADCIDRRTTVLILGDGRSNQTDPRLDLFRHLSERAKRIVWLCPEPPGQWGTGDSCMLQYQPFCTHLSHCSSALDIEGAIDAALQAYA